MLAAILLSFKIYEIYQPTILKNFGFLRLAGWLGIVQGLLSLVIEPIAGRFSDVILRRFSSRLPQITIGVTLAGLIFIGVAWLLQTVYLSQLPWLIPTLMLGWLIAMIAIRGPVVSMLKELAPVRELPRANALLVLALGLVAAVNPLLEVALKQVGASFGFILGAIVLLGGGVLLFKSAPQRIPLPPVTVYRSPWVWSRLLLVFLVGVGVNLGLTAAMTTIPRALQVQFGQSPIEWIVAGMYLVAAVSALPWGKVVGRWGAIMSIRASLGTFIPITGLVLLNQFPVMAILFMAIAGVNLSLLLTSTIPFAIANVPVSQAGLSVGLFLGGGGLAGAIAAWGLGAEQNFNLWTGLLWVTLSFLLTTLCIWLAERFKRA